jgi:rare lipoprotein A (peptidoglycan hydrolase)
VAAPSTTVLAAASDSADGVATWYAAAPPGRCASPWLPFGTVLSVNELATGASITCVVDDREAAGYPHVVDLSPSGFEALAPLGQGTIEVAVSW